MEKHKTLQKFLIPRVNFVFPILFICFFSSPAFSQDAQLKESQPMHFKNEFFYFLGGSYYLGDINPQKHFYMTQPSFGYVLKHRYSPHIAFRFNIIYGGIEGDDSKSPLIEQKERNLNFKSYILEFSVQVEYNFLKYETERFPKYFASYVFLGTGLFLFRPKALYNGAEYELEPLATEGQGTSAKPGSSRYSLTQISIPFGLGMTMNLTERIRLSLEWGMRMTFTDYLDDVSTTYTDPMLLYNEISPLSPALADRSITGTNHTGKTRGNSMNNDWYNFSGLLIGFTLEKPKMKNKN